MPYMFGLTLDAQQLEDLHQVLCVMGQEDVLPESLTIVHDNCTDMIHQHNDAVAKATKVSKAQWN